MVPINVPGGVGSESDASVEPIPANLPVEGSPPDCNTDYSSTGDAHAIILDRATCVDYEIYAADHCATTNPNWTGAQTTIWDFTENEQRPLGWTSTDAAGLSVFEGLIRYDEIESGVINHAIRFTASLTKNDANDGYFIPPATHASGNNWSTNNVIGMRIRLKASFDISGFSPTNQIILTAMKQYGMILADNGGTLYIGGATDPRWNDNDLTALKGITAADFEVVDAPGSGTLSPGPGLYTPGIAPMYPAGELMDENNIPTGNPPTNSLTASATSISAGQSVTLTPTSSGASYNYIDNAGFVRGPITVKPTATTTYTLYSNNAYGSTASTPVTVTVGTTSAPTLAFAAIPTQVLGEAPFSVSATSNSSGAIIYSVLSGPATIAGHMVTLAGTGVVSLQASQAAAGNYSAATAQTSFTVGANTPSLSFSIPNQVYPGGAVTLAATSNSTGAITYSVVSGPATASGTTLTLTGTGTVVVQANQASAGNFTAGSITASSVVTALTNAPANAPQTILFRPLPNFPHGASYQLTARTTSGLPVAYTITSGETYATVSGKTLTVSGTGGTVTVQASTPVDPTGNYASATPVSSTFTPQ
jgi:hypothetical protein